VSRSRKLSVDQITAAAEKYTGEFVQEFWATALETNSLEKAHEAVRDMRNAAVDAQHELRIGSVRESIVDPLSEVLLDDEDGSDAAESDDEPDSVQQYDTLHALVASMNEPYKTIIANYIACVQQQETASQLGVSEAAISNSLKRLKKFMAVEVEIQSLLPSNAFANLTNTQQRAAVEAVLDNGGSKPQRARVRELLPSLDEDLQRLLKLSLEFGHDLRRIFRRS
jgi:DNA-directed RNA polymerase specialized sigma24 family protein